MNERVVQMTTRYSGFELLELLPDAMRIISVDRCAVSPSCSALKPPRPDAALIAIVFSLDMRDKYSRDVTVAALP